MKPLDNYRRRLAEIRTMLDLASATNVSQSMANAAPALAEALQSLVDGTFHCGNPDAECPLHDAHKPWHSARVALDAAAKVEESGGMVRASSVLELLRDAEAKLDADLRDEAAADDAEYAGRVEF